MNDPVAVKIDECTWSIEDKGVRCFLLKGRDRALLIDCGMTLKGVRAFASDLAGTDVTLLLSHADPDHVGALGEFDSFLMHPDEKENLRPAREFVPVTDGQIIELGGRTLEIIHVPGHTPGSIMVLDVTNRLLFSGDSIQNERIFLFGPARNINVFPDSLRRLETFSDRFDLIYPSHGTMPLKSGIIGKIISGTEDVISGKIPGHKATVFGHDILVYDIGGARILGNA